MMLALPYALAGLRGMGCDCSQTDSEGMCADPECCPTDAGCLTIVASPTDAQAQANCLALGLTWANGECQCTGPCAAANGATGAGTSTGTGAGTGATNTGAAGTGSAPLPLCSSINAPAGFVGPINCDPSAGPVTYTPAKTTSSGGLLLVGVLVAAAFAIALSY